jgi:hypothetical protein
LPRNFEIKKKYSDDILKSKKIILIIIPLIIIIFVAIFLLFTSGPDDSVKAQLIIDSGIVQVKHEKGSWYNVENGMQLIQSDSVKTRDNSSATIILFESSIIRLDSNTQITIKELISQVEETKVIIEQDSGRTWNTVLKISGIDTYDVQTPTTVASVRGTSFYVKVLTNGTTDLGVIKGKLGISRIKNGEVLDTTEVEENESVTVDPDDFDKPLEIKPLTIDDWILSNIEKDNGFRNNVKGDLYSRIEQYIPELKEKFGINDEELEALIEGYLLGYYDLPAETPDWVREIIVIT